MTSSMPRETSSTPRWTLKWRSSKSSSAIARGLPHLREDAQVHILLSYHLRQGHIGIDTNTDKNVKVKSSTPTTALRLHHLLWHLRQTTSRHLRLWICGIFADKHLKIMLKRSFPSSSPSLPRATPTSTPTMRFLSMELKTLKSTSSGSAIWTPTSSYFKSPPKIK